ncbi:hypothetical protein [Aquabacterium sp.]|uniref:hypothetical protein n=1 Tax=Aquabacterium sp. TaxID=1872578 RepID=UPI002C3E6947|nr:hypothetical protein [Aquabacterium sp.]HSW06869.1 hypothetical protein [Aquabacterium sp.]
MPPDLLVSRLTPQQRLALIAEAKARAMALRREAVGAVWATLRRGLAKLWPQSRKSPAPATAVTRSVVPPVQNRPQRTLRLLDPRCSPSSLN